MASIALALALAGATVASSEIGANASETASQQQVNQENKALDYTEQTEAPFVGAGQTSIAELMAGLQNGTFGPGSNPTFTPPTLAQAEQTPGYQFEQEQGQLGIDRTAAAAGGAFTGGTLKAGSAFNTNLATTTYQTQFNNAFQSYQAQLAKQAQEYQQLITPATLGANAAAGTSTNVANLMSNIGNAQAAGTVGTANAVTSGISNGTNGILQAYLLNGALNPNSGTGSFNQNSPGGLNGLGATLPTGGTGYTPPPVDAPNFPELPG